MPWDAPLISSVAILVLLQGQKIDGVSQETGYVIDCIKDMIPMQIFNDCCMKENNCTLTRQQNKGIDCMSRMIMSNYSWAFSNSHDGGSITTEAPYNQHNSNNYQWYGDVLDTLGEICKRQPKGRLQNCIRNELIKRCRYSMLQDRITSPPGRWKNRRVDSPYGYDHYNGDQSDVNRRHNNMFGSNNRRNQGGSHYQNRPDYGDTGQQYSRGHYNEDTDEEDFGYSDGDSMKYKYASLYDRVPIQRLPR